MKYPAEIYRPKYIPVDSGRICIPSVNGEKIVIELRIRNTRTPEGSEDSDEPRRESPDNNAAAEIEKPPGKAEAGKSKPVQMVARALYYGSKIKPDGCHEFTAIVRQGDYKTAEKRLIAKVMTELNPDNGHAAKAEAESEGYFTGIFKNCPDLTAENFPMWMPGTFSKYCAYFMNTFLKLADTYGPGINISNMTDFYDTLVNECMSSKNSRGDENRCRKTVSHSLQACLTIYNSIHAMHSEYPLPELNFLKVCAGSENNTEQVKALPLEIRIRFVYCLYRLASRGCAIAFAAAAMYYMGLRTSEAVGVIMGDLLPFGNTNDGQLSIDPAGNVPDHGSYRVTRQVKNGTPTDFLKNENAYRTVPYSSEFSAFVRLRLQSLIDAGLTYEQAVLVPFASPGDLPGSWCRSSDVSSFGVELLMLCGLKECEIQNAVISQREQPDPLADGGDAIDITTYVMRRSRVSTSLSVCGFPTKILDQIVGHKRRSGECMDDVDFNSGDVAEKYAKYMERDVTLPMLSSNPGFSDCRLSGNARVSLSGFQKYEFTAEEDVEVEIHISACEPDSDIKLVTDGILKSNDYSLSNADGLNYSSPPVAALPEASVYDKCIEEAENIDLSPLSKYF